MLDGADHDWSAATDQRTVVYASLSPGRYRFQVRAVTSAGVTSPDPAMVLFTILPPVWRTWWFIMGSIGLVALALYWLHLRRLAHLLAVANVRTRIATDLHDDIGASLSQIAILSEVAQRSAGVAAASLAAPLSEIAGISRELVDSMGDIVWAINPDHDLVTDLAYRMRRLAGDVLGAHRIGLLFRSALSEADLRAGADVRRQVYLIFKEAIHNIVRHSGATRVEVDLRSVEGRLILVLADDGSGFNPKAAYDGHGLVNMRKRAAALGADLEFASAPGEGTRLLLDVRVQRERRLSTLMGKFRAAFGRLKSWAQADRHGHRTHPARSKSS
jgi:signal transduction histidine kinase